MGLLTSRRTLRRPDLGALTITAHRITGTAREVTFTDLAGQRWQVPPALWEHAVSPDATHASITGGSAPLP